MGTGGSQRVSLLRLGALIAGAAQALQTFGMAPYAPHSNEQALQMNIKRFVAAWALAGCALAASALPTVDAVQAQVQRGNFAQAEVMMQDVIAAKPGSARAHYIYAEILAHNKHVDQALKEVERARQIDPAIGFTDAAKFGALVQLLQRQQSAVKPTTMTSVSPAVAAIRPVPPAQPSGGMPTWAWALGLVGLAALSWSIISRRRQSPAAPAGLSTSAMAPATQAVQSGYAPAYGPGPGYAPAATGGSGLMGVGLAAAGGLAAGMLAEKLLHGGHESGTNAPAAAGSSGLVPGLFDNAPADDAVARAIDQRPVDFGTGDDWGGDGGGADDNGGGW
jgi:hypothetical protein